MIATDPLMASAWPVGMLVPVHVGVRPERRRLPAVGIVQQESDGGDGDSSFRVRGRRAQKPIDEFPLGRELHLFLAGGGIFAFTLGGQLPLELVKHLGIRILTGSKLLNHHFPIKQVSHQTIGRLAHRQLTFRDGRSRHHGCHPGPFEWRTVLLDLLNP